MKVTFYATHKGHECEASHLSIRKEKREEIAGMLAAGIPFDDVLDSIQLSLGHHEVSPLNFLTKQHLQNIVRDFGISRGEVLHKDDAESVAAWVEKTRCDDKEKNLVRFVKFQGEEGVRGLRDQDFMII